MKKKNKKRLAVNGKRIVWNAIKALVGVSSVFVVPVSYTHLRAHET